MTRKHNQNELAIFGGPCLFSIPKSTSNLLKPDFEKFLAYSKTIVIQKHCANIGPNVELLEQRLAQFHHADYCVTFCSGFWALALSISAVALKDKTEIIMPSLTYRRMADIAAWMRLRPHFCEVEPDTLALSAATVNLCINQNTALILGVHPIVNCCDVDGLVALAKAHKLPLLFDSVESVYESTASGKVGEFGNAEVFSLHASKFLNGFEGGYITTNDTDLAKQLISMRNVDVGGLNTHLNEVHAAMALASLDGVDEQVERNRQRYYTYKRLLQNISGIRLLEFDESHRTGYKNIVIELLDEWPLSRVDTINILNAENILVRAYYSPALHQKNMAYDYIEANLPLTDNLSEKFLNLPCGQLINSTDIVMIVDIFIFISTNANTICKRLHSNGS